MWDYIKFFKNVLQMETFLKTMSGENIYIYVSNKAFLSRIYKELL